MEAVTDFIYLGSKITADVDCSHEIKRCLLLRRKAMTNWDSILKSRDITLPTKVSIVKVMVFPVVMCGYESWTIKKAKHQRIDAFELWCWRRLETSLYSKEINQSVLKGINPEYSLKGLMLKFQIFGYLMPRANLLLIRKDSDVGKDWRQEEKGTTENEVVRLHHWLNGHEFW